MALSERHKDRIEDSSAAAIEAALAAIPILGGPAAVLANRAMGSAANRRRDQEMLELQRAVAQLSNEVPVYFRPARLASFVGRGSLMDALARTILGDRRAVTLWGIPGSGRRTVALEFAAREGLDLIRLDGRSREAMGESLARSLGQGIASSYASDDFVAIDVPRTALLLIDGVSNLATLRRVNVAAEVKVVITCSFEATYFDGSSIEMEPLDAAETRSLAYKLVPGLPNEDWAVLQSVLHGHPLSLVQALNTCAAANLSPHEWLRLFEASPDVMLDTGHAEGALATSFKVIKNSHDDLMKRDRNAAWLLGLAAVLGEGFVRRSVLEQLIASDIHVIVDASAPLGIGSKVDHLAAKVMKRLREPGAFQAAIVTLRNEGHLREFGADWSMHPLVARAVREILPTRSLVEVAASTLMLGGPQNDPTVSPESLIALSSVLSFARRKQAFGFALYLLAAGNVPRFAAFGMQAQARSATDATSRWFDVLRAKWQDDNLNLLGVASLVGRARAALGDDEEAAEILLLTTKYRFPGEKADIFVSSHVRDLAAVASRLNDPELLQHLRTLISGLKDFRPVVAMVQFNAALADVWWSWSMGKEDSALDAIERSHEIVRSLPRDEQDWAREVVKYVSALFRSKETSLDVAVDALREIDDLVEGTMPSLNEIRRWLSFADLAVERDIELAGSLVEAIERQVALHYTGEAEVNAEVWALEGRVALHRARELKVGPNSRQLADQLIANGIERLERAIDMYKSLPAQGHRSLPAALINLANLYGDRFDFPQALKLAYEARRIDKARWGSNHPEVKRDTDFIRELRSAQADLLKR